MTPEAMRQTLRETLDDRRLSRSEKKALVRILDHVDPTPQTLAAYRRIAFEVAREYLAGPEGNSGAVSGPVLEWLEDVVRVLLPDEAKGATNIRPEAHFSPSKSAPERIANLIRRTQRTLDICVFTITDDRLSDAIGQAVKRGVAVRVLTDDEKAFDRGSDVERLTRAGVHVRTDDSEHHMHHKFALFDGTRLLTGSYNWTRSAARFNQENFIVTGNPALIASFADLFERLWEEHARDHR